MLYETADLMEIAGEDGFRIRSYRNGASTLEGYPERIADVIAKAPPPPPIKRHRIVEKRTISDLTKRCIIMTHLANATPQFAR